MTADELTALRALCAAATPGPWVSKDTEEGNWIVRFPDGVGHYSVNDIWFGDMERNCGEDIHNADFIAASRSAVPALMDALDEATDQLQIARTLLRQETSERRTRYIDEVVRRRLPWEASDGG